MAELDGWWQDPEVKAAMLAKLQAEQAKIEAEAAEAAARARDAEIEAERDAILLAKARDEEIARKARNEFHHVYVFGGGVNSNTVASCMNQLDVWRRTAPGCDIEIVLNSPGGEVIEGMALFDYLQQLRAEGHHITTVARGMAASMGGILLQAGDVRVMSQESYILIHEVAAWLTGKFGELQDEMEFIDMIQDRILNIFASRCRQAGEAGTASQPLTKAQLKRRWSRRDWWLDADAALRHGLCDQIRGRTT